MLIKKEDALQSTGMLWLIIDLIWFLIDKDECWTLRAESFSCSIIIKFRCIHVNYFTPLVTPKETKHVF